jgi:hypothetical protein
MLGCPSFLLFAADVIVVISASTSLRVSARPALEAETFAAVRPPLVM